MSASKGKVPDAWDDDWESLADKQDAAPPAPKSAQKLSKAERRAQHAEFNKQLWESAEMPKETPLFLQAKSDIPLEPDFKPAVKVLSRKPPPKVLSRDPTKGEDDDEDSEEEARRKNEQAFADRQARAQREREEKQRKYAEVRERLFGSSTPDGSQERSSSPRSNGNKQFRGKGRGRGGDPDANSSGDQSPARGPMNPKRQLFDPGYSAKPNSSYVQQQEGGAGSRSATPSLDQPIRAPRGPDGSGRGGFGFASRGDRDSTS